ncbi:sugar transferase [Campylobacter sp. FMV-PI01]|uniref:Sugar transferase n=1 Tax=Campylobacter portucalensis TaxID=2608384 RepID=A0A6L5WM63_9BACT|nr:sugar transferase [Campylobacter portucalensis]MSN96761.1 sugar transferase [Campylobacter portucalensis]
MIILGNKYKFNEIELNKLNKKFKNLKILEYNENKKSYISARQDIKNLLSNGCYKYLVINSDQNINNRMIKFITLLGFKYRKKSIKIISIQKLLEEYLKKLYIPDDDKNLDFLMDIKTYNIFQYSIKKFIDFIACFILLFINFFFKFYVQKKIKEQSPGSLYFIQNRIGKNVKVFKCYKFRTMHENSNLKKYTSKNDDRIFPFGDFLRKTRLDEIPQCFNIIKGDMHLVGPRAEWDILVKEYEQEIPYYNERHIVKPGITGWAQVNYPYGENIYDTKQKLMYDLYYIKHWSIWLEIKIIFATITIMIRKKGI